MNPLSFKLSKKFHNLQQKQNPEPLLTLNQHKRLNLFNNNKDPWIVNLTLQPIPENVSDILRMGEGFSSQFIRKKSDQDIELVKDLESNITKIPIDNRQSFRNTFIEISYQYIRKQQHINADEKTIAKNITLKTKFLHENKDIFVTKADKGNITLLMNRSDYIAKMEILLNDTNNYRLINDDPTLKLNKCTQEILNNWRIKRYLGKDIKKYEINNDNSNLARAYVLPKIHKEKIPLRIIISDINSPTSMLSKYLKTIITKSLPTPTSNIKDS